MTALEKYKGRVMVIITGYTERVAEWMRRDAGLSSRFPSQRRVEFVKLSVDLLVEIGKDMLTARGFSLHESAGEAMRICMQEIYDRNPPENARGARNVIEAIVEAHDDRIDDCTDMCITEGDVMAVYQGTAVAPATVTTTPVAAPAAVPTTTISANSMVATANTAIGAVQPSQTAAVPHAGGSNAEEQLAIERAIVATASASVSAPPAAAAPSTTSVSVNAVASSSMAVDSAATVQITVQAQVLPTYQRSSYQRSPYQRSPYQRSPYQRSPYQRSPYQRSPYQRSQVRLNVLGNQTGVPQHRPDVLYNGYVCDDCGNTYWGQANPTYMKGGKRALPCMEKSRAKAAHKKRCPNRV